ncbi:hypothetical protein CANCADRAFT_31143 [Tortispora caseinolytica NRRL Y-17796]|uniref:Fumarylacetoacetase n=1 Tax=Tortispora caseinolytica NRRL Y-17796 TaxID=767744 RepID=A0A1E4TE91_9ASCO|nr:hypothetical protein CANCADRAFT_31143 [Tortispora caseinolytica NRRL Y-17796]
MSWINISKNSHFSLANIPFGIFSTTVQSKRIGVAIGDYVLDIPGFVRNEGLTGLDVNTRNLLETSKALEQQTLNGLASLGKPVHSGLRRYIQEVFKSDGRYPDVLQKNSQLQQKVLVPMSDVTMHVPFEIGDYTDFYVGCNHAYNCGCIFRGPQNALQPNYYHLPVGYHGRASSVVVSGTGIRRPKGQILVPADDGTTQPELHASKKMDYEFEIAAFVGKSNNLGEPVPIGQANDHLFGFVIMNDWSARDIQAWEYVPLGPFTSKNFGTSISPWVVHTDALEPFRCEPIKRKESDPKVQPYLDESASEFSPKTVHDIQMSIDLTISGESHRISQMSAKYMLYSFPQMIAHHTVTGCNLRVGDLLGSGTISGTESGTEGSMLELSQGGKRDVVIGSVTRRFLEDGDTVTFSAVAGDAATGLVGFGTLEGTVLPAAK